MLYKILISIAFIFAAASVSLAQNLPQLPGGRKIETPVGPAQLKLDPAKVPGLLSPTTPGFGAFEVRGVDSSLCLGYRKGGLTRAPHLALEKCELSYDKNKPGSILISVVPHRISGFTLRVPPAFDDRPQTVVTWLQTCVTGARDVLIGARSLDVLPCDNLDRMAQNTGNVDQRFIFVESEVHVTNQLTDRYFSIKSFEDPKKCLDVRDTGREPGTEIILWDCNGKPNQLFQFRAKHPVVSIPEIDLSVSLGYVSGQQNLPLQIPDYINAKGAAFWRAVPIAGYDLPGSDLQSGFDTANDKGAACAKACALNDNCRAFTFVRPGAQGESAKCWLKKDYSVATTNPNTASGIVRSKGR